MENLLLQKVEYKTEETSLGKWRRFVYPNGILFEEFVSHKRYYGLPFIHYTWGKCPETGKRIIARGVIAIGRLACGGIAIGHASAGIIALGQLSVGLLFGVGQLAIGTCVVGQIAIAALFGFGQLATGYTAIAQFGIGYYVLAQKGVGAYVWDMYGVAYTAQEFFRNLLPFLQ